MAGRWEHFHHGADIGVRGRGDTCEAAFEQAALALAAVITDPEAVEPRESVAVHCPGADLELLLVDWLNAIVYEIAVGHRLFSKFEVRLDSAGLSGRAWGEPVDVSVHHPAIEVKGATYTELRVGRDDSGGWLAQCVVDV